MTQHMSKMATVLDLQDMMIKVGRKEMKMSDVGRAVCEAMVNAWHDGITLVLRLANATPDFMLELNVKDVLPTEIWTAANLTPGCKLTDAHKGMIKTAKLDPKKFRMADGFHICFTSCFSMNDWKEFMRGKMPMGAVQPVQVCRSHQQVADVMRLGVEVEANLDDALSEMDRLADML